MRRRDFMALGSAAVVRPHPGRVPDPSFTARAVQIIGRAVRHALPLVYTLREFAFAGGLYVVVVELDRAVSLSRCLFQKDSQRRQPRGFARARSQRNTRSCLI
jgi:hypothetical protein